MMSKSKIMANAIAEGKKGVKFQIFAAADEFGSMRCSIDFHCSSEEKAKAILAATEKAEEMLDNMVVDTSDPESIQQYIGACGFALEGVMRASG